MATTAQARQTAVTTAAQAAAQAPARRDNAVTAFESILRSDFIDQQLTSALAENKGTFVSSLVELYTGDKALQTCNPKLVALEAVKAASLNLPINKALGFAYIVVYNNSVKATDPRTGRDTWTKVPTPTFVLGYKGFIQLASRTGQYKTINATPVYEGEFRSQNRLTGEIDITGKRTSDKVVGYAGYIEYLNGFTKAEYVTVADMARHALRYSPSLPKSTKLEDLVRLANEEPSAKRVGWLGNFGDMAVKTLIRRIISKYCYMSVQMQNAVALDINADTAMTAADRDQLIGQEQTQTVNLEEAEYEAIDTASGEVTAAPSEAQADEKDDDPGY